MPGLASWRLVRNFWLASNHAVGAAIEQKKVVVKGRRGEGVRGATMPGLASMRLASCLAFITFVIAPTTWCVGRE